MYAKHTTKFLALGRLSVHGIDLASLLPPPFWSLSSACVEAPACYYPHLDA